MRYLLEMNFYVSDFGATAGWIIKCRVFFLSAKMQFIVISFGIFRIIRVLFTRTATMHQKQNYSLPEVLLHSVSMETMLVCGSRSCLLYLHKKKRDISFTIHLWYGIKIYAFVLQILDDIRTAD